MLQILIHIPQYCSRQYFMKERGYNSSTLSTFLYSINFFFSTTVVAQGAFQAWLEKLTPWYSQKQLAGRKATPAKEIFCLGITDLSGGILSTTRQTALLQDSPSQLTPKQPTLPQERMAVTSRPGCDQDELLPTRHLNTGKMPPRP